MRRSGPLADPTPTPADAPSTGQRVALQAAGIWLATRVAIAVLTYFGVIFFGAPGEGGSSGHAFVNKGQSLHSLLQSWQQWDTGWYLGIAQAGYTSPEAMAFFPLYPSLIAAGSVVAGSSHALIVALVVSNLGALAGFIGVALLAKDIDGTAAAGWRAVKVLAAYPLAFFLAAAYTEGLFLAVVAFTMLFAHRRRWLLAAATALIAGFTRPTSAALIPFLVWELGSQRGWWQRLRSRDIGLPTMNLRRLLEAVAAIGAIPLAFAIFATYSWVRFNRPLAPLQAQGNWSRSSLALWDTARLVAGHLHSTPPWTYFQGLLLLDVGAVLIFGVLAVAMIRRLPFSFALFSLALLYLAVAAPIRQFPDPLEAASRFLVVSVPTFLLVGRWIRERPGLEMLVVSGGFMLQAVLATYYLHGGWIA
jgi:hypothetical protein